MPHDAPSEEEDGPEAEQARNQRDERDEAADAKHQHADDGSEGGPLGLLLNGPMDQPIADPDRGDDPAR